MAAKTAFLDDAFPLEEHKELKLGIMKVIETDKKSLPLFKSIGKYVKTLQTQITKLEKSGTKQAEKIEGLKREVGFVKEELKAAQSKVKDMTIMIQNGGGSGGPDAEPGSPGSSNKKRKLDGVDLPITRPISPVPNEAIKLLLTVREISFSVPARKKFNINITDKGVDILFPATGIKEVGVTWEEIRHVCCLPVPEKTARQYNFCVFPKGSEGLGLELPETTVANAPTASVTQATGTATDALVFTIPDSQIKSGVVSGEATPNYDASTYQTLFTSIFNTHLLSSNIQVLSPDPKEFFSSISQPHRPSEKSFHVKCHRGSKEGYLFFLSDGVVWGFKKPMAYFEFVNIDSISYTSITSRTFNLSIHVRGDKSAEEGGKEIEIEFAMIDQADYAGIDQYVKKHRLNDKSMGEKRRAIRYNVNKGERGLENEETKNHGAQTISELEKALEDAEDEEEDDYDPGSDSDGSGSESESDDGEDSDEEEVGDIDLQDELGSELEDVRESEDEMDTRRG